MPKGGKREGAGRKARPISKATPIWCGQISKEDKAFIVKHLSPEERYQVLMAAANTASTRRGGTVAKKGKVAKPPRG